MSAYLCRVIRFICSLIYVKERNNILSKRRYSTRELLWEAYNKTKFKCKQKPLPKDINPQAVFACNEFDLTEIKAFGFDYDYTLAHYKPSLEHLLYNLGRNILVKNYQYPPDILKLEYNPNFAIRGLHYDIEKGLLLKLDTFMLIQFGAVYRGVTPVSSEEVLDLYKNRAVPMGYVEGGSKDKGSRAKMVHLADIFSVPYIGLLCDVTEYFIKKRIEYHPEILFLDVKNAINSSHPKMHRIVERDVEKYIRLDPKLKTYFQMLRDHDKKVFLLTNSPFHFVNAGMKKLVGPEWREYFDVVIVNAGKPQFFTDVTRPIRVFDKKSNTRIWERVTKLEKGIIYSEGTVTQFQELTGWSGLHVLYFGDHPYADLADLALQHGWRTGAIINELTHEINILNSKTFKEDAMWLHSLNMLIEDHQTYDDPEAVEVFKEWFAERDRLRNEMKAVFNPQFGSVFRTYHNPTYFSRRLFRFADIYTSNITNFLNYSLKYTFYPRRGVMPHEYRSSL